MNLFRNICINKVSKIYNIKKRQFISFFSLGIMLFVCLSLFPSKNLRATHNKAGELSYRLVSGTTYEIVLTTYTDTRSSGADRPIIDIEWGDGTTDVIERESQVFIGNFTWRNIYRKRHTYPGPGTYPIQFFDPNRVESIVNMSNSVNVSFYLEAELIIASSGVNNSPILLTEPIDFACVNRVFEHNPNAYDPDGDSLVYTLIPPKQDFNRNVPGYSVPQHSIDFTLDSRTGELVWDAPVVAGIYNIAILIEEFRRNQRIGYVIRDMQITVQNCQNFPPIINPVNDTCVEAGKNIVLSKVIKATDTNSDSIRLTASGGPFEVSPKATFTDRNNNSRIVGKAEVEGIFRWNIDCNHIRKFSYSTVFKAEDNNTPTPLVDLEQYNIKVVGPAPTNPNTNPAGNSIVLTWEPAPCPNARGYMVYRKINPIGYNPDYCVTGVPEFTGYQRVELIEDPNIRTYLDDNNGEGLSAGVTYCYMITAVYLNSTNGEFVEGYPTPEVCNQLKRDVPIITHVDVIPETENELLVKWVKPIDIDTTQTPGPYVYKIYRNNGFVASKNQLITQINANTFGELNTTQIIDQVPNDQINPYSYIIDFFYTNFQGEQLIGSSTGASSIFLNTSSNHFSIDLSWSYRVPWFNDTLIIYRSTDRANFQILDTVVKQQTYSDKNLDITAEYCYYISAYGSYFSPLFNTPFINRSQIACNKPTDTLAPCPLVLKSVFTTCEPADIDIAWELTNQQDCYEDVKEFILYYRDIRTNNFIEYTRLPYPTTSFQINYNDTVNSIASCFAVAAIDTFGNISGLSQYFCSDNCLPIYELPNIFTPGDDDFYNEKFRPINARFIGDFNITIYNRWGNVVYQTQDWNINWDGTDLETGKPVAEGSYYYVAEISPLKLRYYKTQKITGMLYIKR